jgi:hypothetical protein
MRAVPHSMKLPARRPGPRGRIAQVCAKLPYLWLSLLAATTILVALVPVKTPDWARFEDEALSIRAGQGYRTGGQLETALPPGYPLFIALLKLLGLPDEFLPLVHSALFIAACNLVYHTLKPYSSKVAALGMFGLAVQPLAARLTGYYLSESFGLFLCALLLFCVSRAQRATAAPWIVVLTGMLAVFLPLTSPATIVMCLLLALLLMVQLMRQRRFALAAAGIAGALAVMLPWQMHCVSAKGSICPLLLSTQTTSRLIAGGGDQWLVWFRSWSQGEPDMPVLHSRDLRMAPERAFESAAQRASLLAMTGGYAAEPSAAQLDVLEKIAERRRDADPLSQDLLLPLARSFRLWFEMVQIGHAQKEYVGRISPFQFASDLHTLGPSRAGARWLKGVISTIVFGLYVSLPVFALAMLPGAVIRRNTAALLILLAIAAYTCLTGFSAATEARRNIVFFPAIIFLLGISTRSQSRSEGTTSPSQMHGASGCQ